MMAKFIAGSPISESFALRGGTTGETFTVANATKPGGAWAGPVITEVGGGVYQAAGSASGTETTLGFYQATITGNTTGQVFTLTWEVVPEPAPILPTRANGQVPMASWWNDLQDKVSRIAGRVGES